MKRYDAIIVGMGPAGMSAAAALAEHGGRAVVIDSASAPGGQLVKQIHKFFGSAEVCAGVRGIRLADRLHQQGVRLGVEFLLDHTVYGIEAAEEGYVVYAAGEKETVSLEAPSVILATGASENALPFPGWTLPGVITAGAAQTLVNLYRVPCGKKALIVGAGNVGLIVAYQLMQAGMDIEAVIEAAPKIGGYEVHANKIRRAGVPVLTGHTILEARGGCCVEEAVIARVDRQFAPIPGTERTLAVDTVCLAVGLSPLTKLAELSGCEIRWDSAKRQRFIAHDANMMTSRPGVFTAGDAAGVEEASIAMEEGAVAGLRAAEYLGLAAANEVEAQAREREARIRAIRTVKAAPEKPAADAMPAGNRPRAVIECYQGIPCNPCEKNCPSHAIVVGEDLSSPPVVNPELCIGCGRCVAVCPGQACFMVGPAADGERSEVFFPYEYLPVPRRGSRVMAADRQGNAVCEAVVNQVKTVPAYDGTYVVSLLVPKEYAGAVRGIAREGEL